ncbi:hypothetical protein AAC387_Pa07g0390 [Persea americana]
MRLLNDDEGWELFMKKIFPGGDPSTACPTNLEKTGRKILAKCGGLPLAILTLGGLLARIDKTPSAWSRVLESVNWYLNESSQESVEDLNPVVGSADSFVTSDYGETRMGPRIPSM